MTALSSGADIMIAPSFCVVIPTFKRSDMLTNMIDAVVRSTLFPARIFLVYRPFDDAGTVSWIEENAERYELLQPLQINEPGKVAAQNLALSHCQTDIIVILDDDIVIGPHWFDTILGHFSDPAVGAVGGRDFVHGPFGSATFRTEERAGYRDFWGRVIGNHHCVGGASREVDVLKGCNWALRKSALGSLRFDERLLGTGAQAGDDYWFCLNLRRGGWKIILDPTVVVDHFPAYKPDYAQGTWGRKKCYEWTANITAQNLAFLPFYRRLIYLFYAVVVGSRHCPGMYFLLHSIVKRPRAVAGQLAGGWEGLFKGLRMAKDFRQHPPGHAYNRR